ncbi:hypothetical protein J4209_04185 [Candidatus Woesearchaeota archaeon]|nr:hypothetical protein [Candidatus Woesearchaeota archaeon]
MVTYVYSANWFHGIESVFDIIYIVVALLITYFSYKGYKYIPKKNYLYFAFSFFLIAASFFIKMLSDITIYSRGLAEKSVEVDVVKSYVIQRIDWVYNIQFYGFIFARFLVLLAFLMLLVVALKIRDKKIIGLLVYLMVVTALYSEFSFVAFHITLALMLLFLAAHYWKSYKKQKKGNSKFVFMAFFAIFLSQVVFSFVELSQSVYVVGAVLQLIGYLLLFYTIVLVLKK